jgi:hypothetical protein
MCTNAAAHCAGAAKYTTYWLSLQQQQVSSNA